MTRLVKWFKEFMYGMVLHEPAIVTLKERAALESLFILVTFGHVLGVPVLPTYYSLRLLPPMIPLIEPWRRRMLRERDWTDWAFD
ncbi:MAG: hypothetical protein AB1646_07610 [Thermodesulfobacteriota bacterium]